MGWPSNKNDALSKKEVQALNQKFGALDEKLGIEVSENFEPFDQMNDMFTRAFWDETVRSEETDAFFNSYRMAFAPKRGEGFSQKDFALRNAAWSLSDIVSNRRANEGAREGFQSTIFNDTPVAPSKAHLHEPAIETAEIKKIAKLFGADLVGVCEIDPRWHYTNRVDTRDFSPSPNELPPGLTHVIVMGHAMERDLVDTYPSALAGASTGLEYSHETAIVIQLASYIRNLGFEAIASMNDTALVVPYAIKAGLGEYGRNQMVLTPEFGPRVRFSKIFTSLPLLADAPKPMGLHAYCQVCTKCADACPPKALPFDAPYEDQKNRSTIKGVKKWSADCEKCFGYWAKLKTDCAICMRVCPFNRDTSTMSQIWYRLATSRWRKLAAWWDRRRGTPPRLKPKDWWRRLNGA